MGPGCGRVRSRAHALDRSLVLIAMQTQISTIKRVSKFSFSRFRSAGVFATLMP